LLEVFRAKYYKWRQTCSRSELTPAAQRGAGRPKVSKLMANDVLHEYVQDRLGVESGTEG